MATAPRAVAGERRWRAKSGSPSRFGMCAVDTHPSSGGVLGAAARRCRPATPGVPGTPPPFGAAARRRRPATPCEPVTLPPRLWDVAPGPNPAGARDPSEQTARHGHVLDGRAPQAAPSSRGSCDRGVPPLSPIALIRPRRDAQALPRPTRGGRPTPPAPTPSRLAPLVGGVNRRRAVAGGARRRGSALPPARWGPPAAARGPLRGWWWRCSPPCHGWRRRVAAAWRYRRATPTGRERVEAVPSTAALRGVASWRPLPGG